MQELVVDEQRDPLRVDPEAHVMPVVRGGRADRVFKQRQDFRRGGIEHGEALP
jgi:hypothetical protein